MSPKYKKKNISLRKGEKIIQLGKLFKKTNNNLILIGDNLPNLGEKVYDEKMMEIGYVSNVFGRIENFFIVVKCHFTNQAFSVNENFYVIRSNSNR